MALGSPRLTAEQHTASTPKIVSLVDTEHLQHGRTNQHTHDGEEKHVGDDQGCIEDWVPPGRNS
jgi:hypothetical protein